MPGSEGPQGEEGKQGEQGLIGEKGERGRRGLKGHRGDLGMLGPKGDLGEKGQKGDRGLPGPEGQKGEVGALGLIGHKGETGKDGPVGPSGIEGLKGQRGETGPKGDSGLPGKRGKPGKAAEGPYIPPEFFAMFDKGNTKGNTRRRRFIDQFETAFSPQSTENSKTVEDINLYEMYKDIYNMKEMLDYLIKPDGSKDYPSRTCMDLQYGNPKFESGWFWIDPNGGLPHDAIYVYCKKNHNGVEDIVESCVFPDEPTAEVPNTQWRTASPEVLWFSDMIGGSKITYETNTLPQINFLKISSNRGYQNFTIVCQNSLGFGENLRIRGVNNDIIGSNDRRLQVIKDECRVSIYN